MDNFSVAFGAIIFLLFMLDINVDGKLINDDVSQLKKNACDLFKGRWVYDESYPLYDSSVCPFIEKQFNCLRNGRPDRDYLKYRWQPKSCNLPRFNATEFQMKFKGKRLMFVGDSLSLDQWQSLTCMLHAADPQAAYISKRTGPISFFTFPKYNTSYLIFRNVFLVNIITESNGTRVLELDFLSVDQWKEMDVIVFDSWHWWLHTGRKQPWDLVQDGNSTYKDASRFTLYEKALTSWAKWVDTKIDTTKTKIFFQGVSPDHKNCVGARRPLKKNTQGPHPGELVLEKVLRSMKKTVHLLNVTKLSQYRVDGHPSVYGFGGHRNVDCTHWCVAGVVDTWNLLLTALLDQF